MYSSHGKFIQTPLITILQDGVNACLGADKVIEAYPLYEYVIQSIFIRMCGAQEQKMKCICWEIANIDYEFRNDFLNKGKTQYGEFSTYKHKNNLFQALLDEIKKYDAHFDIKDIEWTSSTGLNSKINFAKNIKASIENSLENSILSINDPSNYLFWKKDDVILNADHFAIQKNLLVGKLCDLYENDVIKHRHRCAHNLTSYQQDIPPLSTLSNKNNKYYNYFFRFTILILIDEIFIRLYKKYLCAIDNLW